jgi:hypothetical protein
MADFLSEAVTVRLAPESVKGVAPSSGWQQLQIDVGGVANWRSNYTDVERDIHSKYLTLEKGDHVAKSIEPSITHDFNKDFADTLLASAFRCTPAHFGGTGVSLFRPTAVTSTGYTVAASGALANSLLVYARGFTTPANNGLKLTAGTSTGTEIKTPGLTAEASPPASATVDVVGFQGATGDIAIDASGDLTATALNLTTLGLSVGDWIYLPTADEATAMGSANYALAVSGRARIKTIAAGKLTLERRTFAIGAASGVGKTVRVFTTSRLMRNYALDHASYASPTMHGEKEDIREDGTTRYTYCTGLAVNTLEISAPIDSKITATVGFVGMDATDPLPSGSRVAGASSARAPLATALLDTQNDLQEVRLTDASGALVAEINSWTFSLSNNVTPKKVQGIYGAAGHNYGKFNYNVQMEAYYSSSDAIAAITENRDGLAWDAFVRNHQYGFVIDLPNVALRDGDLSYAANQPVMITCQVPAFRNEADNIAGSICVFGYLPTT